MNYKRTILIVRNAAKQDFGGAETYPVSLASILETEGYHPVIITRSKKLLNYAKNKSIQTHKGWWLSKQNWSGWRIIFLPLYLVWQIVLTVWYIYIIIRSSAIAIHVQSRDDFIAGTIAGRFCRIQVVWTDHMDLRYIFQNISKPFRNPVGKLVFAVAHIANHIIIISDNELRLVTSHFKNKDALSKQIILIKNGVIDYKPSQKQFNNDTIAFCLASRMVKNKGVAEAIQAFAELQRQLGSSAKVQLNIYGDGPDIQHFKKMAEGTKNITFFGYQDNAIDKINQSNVFILPSYQEGFSIALLEATMLGKPIIASDVDSNPEIIKDNKTGLLVKVRDITALQEAMYKLATNEQLRQNLGHNARQNYEDNFNLVTITKNKITPLYSSAK